MKYFTILFAFLTISCAKNENTYVEPLPPLNVPLEDNSVPRARAIVEVGMSNQFSLLKLLNPISVAYAATGAVVVNYTNAAAVNFSMNATNFVAGGFTGDTLSLGSITVSTLSDNNLKVCNPGGNTKCTQAIFRVYTTGSTTGFVNTGDTYGAPVYVGTLNPSTALGLNSAGAVNVQTYTIPANKNKITISDFPSPTYNVTSDFSNAGSGNYSMTFVLEYALAP